MHLFILFAGNIAGDIKNYNMVTHQEIQFLFLHGMKLYTMYSVAESKVLPSTMIPWLSFPRNVKGRDEEAGGQFKFR